MKTHLQESTKDERAHMLSCGMRELTPDKLAAELKLLGYVVDRNRSFNYSNTGNARSYDARATAIIHEQSKLCFSNVESPKTNLPELQKIRFNTFCYQRGRIWEL